VAKLEQMSPTTWKQPLADRKREFGCWWIPRGIVEECDVKDSTRRLLRITFDGREKGAEVVIEDHFSISSGKEVLFPASLGRAVRLSVETDRLSSFTVDILDSKGHKPVEVPGMKPRAVSIDEGQERLLTVPVAGDATHNSYATRLKISPIYGARMRAIAARSARIISAIRPEWYRARVAGKDHLRIFCGHFVVLSLEGKYVWLALDTKSVPSEFSKLQSLKWDTATSRPKDAKGEPYPRYIRPSSRNAFYDPAKDTDGQEWSIIEGAHDTFLKKAVVEGRAPDHRTKSDPGLTEEITTWDPSENDGLIFGLAVKESLQLPSEERVARLQRARKLPRVRLANVIVFDRNADVVAELLCRAEGVCELCKKPAPFARASDGTPYLEVHHRQRLADGGEDTVENAIAICPNCHRQQHFG
jgi:hypothetical protein